jgi:hypothetical protein
MAASAVQFIVRGHEEGTVALPATTPTRAAAVSAGKSLAVGVNIAVQIAVLLAASALLFGILLMSFVRDSRHVGAIIGVGLNLTSMVGGLFTNFIPGSPVALGGA